MIFVCLAGALMIIGFVSAYFGRTYQNNMGFNVGDKYLKETFGVEEGKNYHE